jgi:hypothetical protein
MNLHEPARYEFENSEMYKARRSVANMRRKLIRQGQRPTMFLQRGPGVWPKGDQLKLDGKQAMKKWAAKYGSA